MQDTSHTKGFIKKETVVMLTLVALVIGFFGGITFSVFKSPTSPQQLANVQQPAQHPQENAQAQANAAAKEKQILEIEKELATNPKKTEAWINLGNLYFDTNQFEKAVKAYSKSLELKPDNPGVLTDLGVMYRRLGKPNDAIAAFEKAFQVDPKHEQSRFNKGVVQIADLNDRAAAIKTWEELLQINPFSQAPNGQLLKDILEHVKKTS